MTAAASNDGSALARRARSIAAGVLLLALAACAAPAAVDGFGSWGGPVGRLVAGDIASRDFKTVGAVVQGGYRGTVTPIDTPVTVQPAPASYTGSARIYAFHDLTLINRTNFDGVDLRGGGAADLGLRGSVRADGNALVYDEAIYVDALSRSGPAYNWRNTATGGQRGAAQVRVLSSVLASPLWPAMSDLHDALQVNLSKPVVAPKSVKTGDLWWTAEELRQIALLVTRGLEGATVSQVQGGGTVLGVTVLQGRRAVVVTEDARVTVPYAEGTAALGTTGYAVYDVATGLPLESATFGVMTVRRTGRPLPAEVWTVATANREIRN